MNSSVEGQHLSQETAKKRKKSIPQECLPAKVASPKVEAGILALLALLQRGWILNGCVLLCLGVVQHLMQQERGLQAAVLQLSTQGILNILKMR